MKNKTFTQLKSASIKIKDEMKIEELIFNGDKRYDVLLEFLEYHPLFEDKTSQGLRCFTKVKYNENENDLELLAIVDENDTINEVSLEFKNTNNCKDCSFIFVKKQKSNGGYMLKKQCLLCGMSDGKTYKFDLVGGSNNVSNLPIFNEPLQEIYYKKQHDSRQKQYEEERLEKRKEFFDVYKTYLKSDKWKRKRIKVLERDNYKCKACETNKATQVHHTSYEFVYDEPLFDLVSVCKPCHDKIESIKLENKGLSS